MLVIAALFGAACSRMDSSLRLQPNPVLTGGLGYGVVRDSYVRLKAGPSDSTPDVDHLRRGSVYLLSEREFGTGDDQAKTPRELWYSVEAEGSKGWVRDDELDRYSSRAQAERAAAAYR